MNFSQIVEPELTLLGDSATHILSVAPVSMSPFATQLLVEISYIDNSKIHKAYYIYDPESGVFTVNLSDYLGGIEVVDITSVDVAWSGINGTTIAIAYIDKTESSYLATSTGNRIAIIQDGELLDKDIIETASNEVANTGLNNIIIDSSGTKVVFSSAANNLVNYLDTNDVSDVFLVDIVNNTLNRVSQITDDDEGGEPSYALGLSTINNITQVLFETASAEFSSSDLNEKNDLYLSIPGVDKNTLSLVSTTTNNEAASLILNQAIIVRNSIVYVSDSDELVDGDSNQSQDIFIQNIDTNTLQRLTSELDAQLGIYDAVSYGLLGIDSNLNQLMFSSNYTTLNIDPNLFQIYLMDLSDQSIVLISQTPNGEVGNDTSVLGVMDDIGSNYAYQTEATNLVETPGGVLITSNKPSVQLFDHSQKGITNLSLDLYLDGNSLDKSIAIDKSSVLINEVAEFDVVKISDTDAYDFDASINITDAIDILRHIVALDTLADGSNNYHAADVNNDGNINISDAIAVLRHIVDLEPIDTFDIIDANGARVTSLDADATGDAPIWTIVANGDVNMSGSFDDVYTIASDLI